MAHLLHMYPSANRVVSDGNDPLIVRHIPNNIGVWDLQERVF